MEQQCGCLWFVFFTFFWKVIVLLQEDKNLILRTITIFLRWIAPCHNSLGVISIIITHLPRLISIMILYCNNNININIINNNIIIVIFIIITHLPSFVALSIFWHFDFIQQFSWSRSSLIFQFSNKDTFHIHLCPR